MTGFAVMTKMKNVADGEREYGRADLALDQNRLFFDTIALSRIFSSVSTTRCT
jgi:hypothetical protein